MLLNIPGISWTQIHIHSRKVKKRKFIAHGTARNTNSERTIGGTFQLKSISLFVAHGEKASKSGKRGRQEEDSIYAGGTEHFLKFPPFPLIFITTYKNTHRHKHKKKIFHKFSFHIIMCMNNELSIKRAVLVTMFLMSWKINI